MRARLDEVVHDRLHHGAAVPAITCYGASTAVAVVTAAEDSGLPVILLVAPSTAASPGGLLTIKALRAIADAASVPVCVQLDHATEPSLIRAAIEAGVDAVLADGSRLALRDNIAFLRDLRPLLGDVVLEAELGSIAGDEDQAMRATASAAGKTNPTDVAVFIEASGAELLACAVGNVHGSYVGVPQLDWDLIAQIRAASTVPLVLHGASGLADDDLARAAASGIGKVNFNTELRTAMLDSLEKGLPSARQQGENVFALTTIAFDTAHAFTTSVLHRLTR